MATATVIKHLQRSVTEREGSDTILFHNVPGWVRFDHIPGFKYRIVTMVRDHGDESRMMRERVTFFGPSGASGWADRVGSVAIYYMGEDWFIFSKIFPFAEHAESKDQHDDLLLLGSANDVMLTPECVSAAPHGLCDPQAPVTTLTCEGGFKCYEIEVYELSQFCRWRLWLTWGHQDEPFRTEVSHMQMDKAPMEAMPTSLRQRVVTNLKQLWRTWNGHVRAKEHPERYPDAPLDPRYYNELLGVASHQTADEFLARQVAKPQPSPRSAGDRNAARVGGQMQHAAPFVLDIGGGSDSTTGAQGARLDA